jgi:hypothetical protein
MASLHDATALRKRFVSGEPAVRTGEKSGAMIPANSPGGSAEKQLPLSYHHGGEIHPPSR